MDVLCMSEGSTKLYVHSLPSDLEPQWFRVLDCLEDSSQEGSFSSDICAQGRRAQPAPFLMRMFSYTINIKPKEGMCEYCYHLPDLETGSGHGKAEMGKTHREASVGIRK
ncbi:Hypothetical predicted protein [Podarcis lilfordi]|uniref:Uncharacterized protein n=1 Tax=Podarcis lilfordi TaxID=74358 RepID=A0AA35K6B9_9SAUR|nr:Hypothetical predicted protein [Podarcis lilfordi]